MASARIPIDRSKVLGAPLAEWASLGELFRQRTIGLNDLLQGATGYNGDNTSAAPDMGASVTAAQALTLMNLITQATGELVNTATTQVSVGATSGTRQALDAISSGR